MSNYDFYAAAPASTMPAPSVMTPPTMALAAEVPATRERAIVPPPASGSWLRPWHFVAGIAVVVVAAVVAVVLMTSGSSKPGRPDPGTARVFGQEARTQLPAPVTADECESAMHAFPAIENDQAASAAFLAGCEG